MSVKGKIKTNHIPVNKFTLLVLGMPPLTIVSVSGIEEQLEVTKLPDRTVASGGNTGSVEFDAVVPTHHSIEQVAWELWYKEAQIGSPTYKRPASLVMYNLDGSIGRTYTLLGLFPRGRSTPALDMANEGEMAKTTFKMAADEILPA